LAFPDSFVEEVRRSADIVRYISEQVPLRRMGTSWKGLCPFHQEKTASFNVRAEPAVFHCFGCGEGGDVFKFVMLRERVAFPEAVEMVARRFGVALPDTPFQAGPERKEREELLALLEAATEHFARNLWTAPGTKAREYLHGRGFKKETLERIRAGAAADSWGDLLEAMKRRFPPHLLLAGGLVLEKEGRGHQYDRFRNRAVFPIGNEAGKVVAFGARSLDGSEPKYLNSPESPVYHKGRVLYGMQWAKDAIRREGRVVLMEGYLDVARALEAGVTEAVATCGTALTAGHARLLRRFSEAVVVNFDQDQAGQKAARKSLDVLLEEGLKVQVVELPEGHDPDSYLKGAGAPAYRQRLQDAPVYMEWLIRRAAGEHDIGSPAGKSAFLQALLPSLARLPSAVERAAWLPTIVEAGALDERAAQEELRRALIAARSSVSLRPAEGPARPSPSRAILPAERWLLALIVKEEEGLETALLELEELDMAAIVSGPILQAARATAERGERVTLAALSARMAREEDRRLLTEMAVAAIPTEGASPLDCVRQIKCWPLQARMAALEKEIARARDEALDALLAEKLSLGQRIAEFSRAETLSP